MNSENSTKNVLIIKTSPAGDYSASNEIADYLMTQLDDKQEGYNFTIRDLAKTPAPIYDTQILNTFYGDPEQLTDAQKALEKPSLEYIEELKAADIIVFASPMHNFSVSTLMKSYIDQICRMGMTFNYTENGPVGLLNNKKGVVISSAGGDFGQEPQKQFDFQTPYMRRILNFIGIDDITVIPVYGLGMGEEVMNLAKSGARNQVKELAVAEL